jgi:hypothetical protein
MNLKTMAVAVALLGMLVGAEDNLRAQQVGAAISADGATPNTNAMLDVRSPATGDGKGLLIPRVTENQRTNASAAVAGGLLDDGGDLRGGAAQGLMVYQTDGEQGFYYNTSATATPSWQQIGVAGGATGDFMADGSVAMSGNLNAGGQALTNVSLISFSGVNSSVGQSANGAFVGAAVGYLANGSSSGAAMGAEANGYYYGAALGRQANGSSLGAAVGNLASGVNSGAALGAQANGSQTNVAIGAYANAQGGTERIAIGHRITNVVDNSAAIRGTLYLDGGTGVLYRSTFGSGGWTALGGGGIDSYAYCYQLATVADATVVGGADLVLSNNGPLSGITHTAGTTPITVPNAGTYKVEYSVSITAGIGAQMAIAVNGTVDASTAVDFLVATGNISGTAMLTLAAGDVITLRNNSAVPFTTTLSPGVGAQLTVTQLN